MTDKAGKMSIQLKLTKCQQAQIRQATGREVNRIELRLHALPELAEGPAGGGGERASNEPLLQGERGDRRGPVSGLS